MVSVEVEYSALHVYRNGLRDRELGLWNVEMPTRKCEFWLGRLCLV